VWTGDKEWRWRERLSNRRKEAGDSRRDLLSKWIRSGTATRTEARGETGRETREKRAGQRRGRKTAEARIEQRE
jgi:hypothetical protein